MRRIFTAFLCIVLPSSFASGCEQLRDWIVPEQATEAGAQDGSQPGALDEYYDEAALIREEPLPEIPLELEPGDAVFAPRVRATPNLLADPAASRKVFDIQFVERIDGDMVYLRSPLEESVAVPSAMVIPLTAKFTRRLDPGDRILVVAAGNLAVGVIGGSDRRDQTAMVRTHRMRIRYKPVPGRYRLIDGDSPVGHFAFCTLGNRRETYLIMHETDDRFVAISGQDYTRAFRKSECELLPLRPTVKVGDTVHAEMVGIIREARVDEVNPDEESIRVSFPWRAERRTFDLAYGLFRKVDDEVSEE